MTATDNRNPAGAGIVVRDEYTQGQATIPSVWGRAREDVVDFVCWCDSQMNTGDSPGMPPEHLMYIVDELHGAEFESLVADMAGMTVSWDDEYTILTKDPDDDMQFDALGIEIVLRAVSEKHNVPACHAASVVCAYYGARVPGGYSSLVYGGHVVREMQLDSSIVSVESAEVIIRGTQTCGRKLSNASLDILWCIAGNMAVNALDQAVHGYKEEHVSNLHKLHRLLSGSLLACPELLVLNDTVVRSVDIVEARAWENA